MGGCWKIRHAALTTRPAPGTTEAAEATEAPPPPPSAPEPTPSTTATPPAPSSRNGLVIRRPTANQPAPAAQPVRRRLTIKVGNL